MTDLDYTKVAPWSEGIPALLGHTLSHTARAWVEHSGGITNLELKGGNVSFDERRSPRVQASLVCRMSTDQGVLEAIDPRSPSRLCIEVGYLRPDGMEESYQIVDLGLRSRYVDRPADEMTLSGASDEAIVIDGAPSNGNWSTNGSNQVLAIQDVLRRYWATITVIDRVTGSKGSAVTSERLWDKWDTIVDHANSIDAQVYDDGMGNWIVETQPGQTTPAAELMVGVDGTILTSRAGLDRDEGWYNRVLIKYDWINSSDVRQEILGEGKIYGGNYAATDDNTRTLELTRNTWTNQTRADNAAKAMARRTVTRGRLYELTAISAYWLRPGHTVTVALPLGDAEDHIVSAVAFDLRAGTMQVVTRLPDNTGTTGA